jgi:hypothetical protein
VETNHRVAFMLDARMIATFGRPHHALGPTSLKTAADCQLPVGRIVYGTDRQRSARTSTLESCTRKRHAWMLCDEGARLAATDRPIAWWWLESLMPSSFSMVPTRCCW